MKKKWFWIAVVLMILFGFSIGYWFQRNKNSNTGQTESQTKLKENTKETGRHIPVLHQKRKQKQRIPIQKKARQNLSRREPKNTAAL